MNKYQEALDNIGDISIYYEDGEGYCILSESFAKGDYYLLKELVEKSVTKKPIYKRDRNIYVCGNCEERFPYTRDGIDQYMYPYCPYCGQRADWSEEE